MVWFDVKSPWRTYLLIVIASTYMRCVISRIRPLVPIKCQKQKAFLWRSSIFCVWHLLLSYSILYEKYMTILMPIPSKLLMFPWNHTKCILRMNFSVKLQLMIHFCVKTCSFRIVKCTMLQIFSKWEDKVQKQWKVLCFNIHSNAYWWFLNDWYSLDSC